MKKNKKDEDRNFLLYVPQINHENYEKKGEMIVLYFEHNRLIEKFACWLVGKANRSDITLDEQSSVAWQLIDGERNINAIAIEMCVKFGDTKEIAIDRLVKFYIFLWRKGWIKFKDNI